MTGHQPLIELRKQGKKPNMVFLIDYDCLPHWQNYNEAPEICIAKDQPFLCDFRFLSGLSVSITASSKERAIKFYEHCKQSGAVIVASTFCNNHSWDSYFAFYNKQTNFEKIQDDL